MLEAYRPIMLLTALWPTQDFEFPDKVEPLADRLKEQFKYFNEHRVVQSTGAPLPPEMARLGLLGERRQWALDLAPGKITLRCSPSPPRALGDLFAAMRERLGAIHTWLAENHNLYVYRMGSLTQLFCNTQSSANEKIANYFLQPRALQDQTPHDMQLGVMSRVVLGGDTIVNRWLRVNPLRSNDARRVDFAARIEVDLNTPPDDTRVKTGRDLARFQEAAERHLSDEIPLFKDEDFLA